MLVGSAVLTTWYHIMINDAWYEGRIPNIGLIFDFLSDFASSNEACQNNEDGWRTRLIRVCANIPVVLKGSENYIESDDESEFDDFPSADEEDVDFSKFDPIDVRRKRNVRRAYEDKGRRSWKGWLWERELSHYEYLYGTENKRTHDYKIGGRKYDLTYDPPKRWVKVVCAA